MHNTRILAVLAAGILLAGALTVPVSAKSSSELQDELNQYEEELSDSEAQSADLTEQITDLQKEVGTLTSDLESLNIQMREYREGMTLRIKYFYEENPVNAIMETLLGAQSFSELLSQLDYLQSIYDYDAEQMEQYEDLIEESGQKKETLNESIEEMSALLEAQETLQEKLEASISDTQGEIAQAEAREEEARKEAEEAAKAEAEKEAAEKKEAEELEEAAKATVSSSSDLSVDSSKSSASDSAKSSAKSSASDNAKSSASADSGSSSSSGNSKSSASGLVSYNGSVAVISMYPNDSGGVLTRSKGVVYYNGHKETWYSQRILPGGGLKIPGRHVDENGLIRDGDGYICVASSDLPKGTLIETSLGMGKVYDSGCASGTIDIYTDW